MCHEGCSILESAGGQAEIPNFDLQVRLRSGKRLWVNLSTVVWRNPRNQHRLVIHMAHDITRQRQPNKQQKKCCECLVNSPRLPKGLFRVYPP